MRCHTASFASAAPEHRLRRSASFGRGPVRVLAAEAPPPALAIGDDLRLFASTFAAGFLFMTLFLA